MKYLMNTITKELALGNVKTARFWIRVGLVLYPNEPRLIRMNDVLSLPKFKLSNKRKED
jgi:hypothetical protein